MKNIFNNRKFKKGLNATILTLAVIGIIILLNILLTKYTYRKDVTANKNFELSPQTKTVLSTLDKSGRTLNVFLFTGPGLDPKTEGMIEGIAKQYEKSSKNFKLQRINLESNPAFAKKYNITSTYDTVFDMEGRTKTVALMDMFQGMNFNGEQAYTGAINTVMNENPAVVYFIQGHKEKNIDKDATMFKRYIERDGYVIKTLDIATEGKVPEDASMLIDFGPETDFPQKELDILKGYLDGGGKAIFLPSFFNPDVHISSLNNLLKNYGVSFNDDIVTDSKKNFYGAVNSIIPEYQNHDIVNKLKEQQYYYMIIPASRSINVAEGVNDISVQPLLKSSKDSWGETSFDQFKNQKSALDANDKGGPLTIAAFMTKTVQDKQAKLVVVGNDLFLLDDELAYFQSPANLDFILNSMGALRDVKNAITLRSKPVDYKPIVFTPAVQRGLGLTLIVLLPGAILIAGLTVWLRRRFL